MRLTTFNFLFLLLIAQHVGGQNDPAAVKILDRFSSTSLGAPSVSMKFVLIRTDQMESTSDTIKGSIILSKNMYKLDLGDNITWFNGETAWGYLPAEKEVTITKPDKKDNSFQNRPSSIFSMYKKGFKTRLIEEKPDMFVIDLYPEDIKSDLLLVRLNIGKALMDLRSLEYKQRDGIIITVHIKDYNLKVKPEADTFIFQPGKFKDVEVIDMR